MNFSQRHKRSKGTTRRALARLMSSSLWKGWVIDATCLQNSRHVGLFWVFDL